MRQFKSLERILFVIAVAGFLVISGNMIAQAQPGPSISISNDFLPYQDFDEPIDTGNGSFVDNAQVQLKKMKASLSYPIIFSEGRTVLVNEFSYQLIEFKYRNFTESIKKLHAASYTLMLQHQLSEKWSVWAIGTPSLASDLEADISKDDFNFQAVSIFIRQYSERLSIGYGAAYSTQFGSVVPLPVLAVDWNNGSNLMVKAILPVSLEFWYRPGARVDFGLVVAGDGNNFNGDPDIYDVTSPELRYTMLTLGPAARIKLSNHMLLNLEAGLVGLHRFEFYDGDDEVASYDLKPSRYFRLGIQFGGL